MRKNAQYAFKSSKNDILIALTILANSIVDEMNQHTTGGRFIRLRTQVRRNFVNSFVARFVRSFVRVFY